MKTNLAANIKRLRKKHHLTQEELATAMNVTVGTIYKWESELSTPDIMTIMDLASFFSLSVDSLIGFVSLDKSLDIMINEMNLYKRDKKYDEALSVMEKALVLYPNSLKLLVQASKLIEINALDRITDKNLFNSEIKRAIALLDRAKLFVSDSSNPRVEYYKIEMSLASLYLDLNDNKRAIEILKENNVSGVNDSKLALIMSLSTGELFKEGELYLTRAFNQALGEIVEALRGYMNYFERLKSYNRVLEVIDLLISIINACKGERGVFYMEKYLGFLYFKRAIALKRLNRDSEIYDNLIMARDAIIKYDNNPTPTNMDIKFYLRSDEVVEVLDSIGPTSLSVLESYLNKNEVDSFILDIWRNINNK